MRASSRAFLSNRKSALKNLAAPVASIARLPRRRPMSDLSPQRAIVHLDDSADDLMLFEEAVAMTQTPFQVFSFESPESALACVKGKAPFDDNLRTPPAIFLCDYNLGADIKAHNIIPLIRGDLNCASVLIIVFSGGGKETGVALSYQAGADHFLRKPASVSRLGVLAEAMYQCVVDPTGIAALKRLPEYEAPGPTHPTSGTTSPSLHTRPGQRYC